MNENEIHNEGKRAFMIVYEAQLVDENTTVTVTPCERKVSNFEWFTQEEIFSLQLYPEHTKALDMYFVK